ncbi:unnamed protein product [Durusdinium trenchii]|uniref:Pentatricopeptide repeat-containing protein, chloroplastic n=1 Tax=Durusdinium trenchii TaxID=1381693 RepID=A0ABP0IZU4_9DINO
MCLLHVQSDQISQNARLAAVQFAGKWQHALETSACATVDTCGDVASLGAAHQLCAWSGSCCASGKNTIASACQKALAWLQACALILGMESSGLQEDIVSFNTFISTLESESIWSLAVDGLQVAGLRPSRVTFSTSISSCSKATAWHQALERLQRPEAESEISYGAALSACERGCKWQPALQLLHRMPQREMMPQKVCHNAVLSAFARIGLWQPASHLLDGMRGRRAAPDEVSSNAAISACEKRSGLWDVSLVLLGGIAGLAAKCTSITFNAVISACETVLHWPRSFALLQHMASAPLTLQNVGCNAALGACQKALEWQRALGVLRFMRGVDASFSEITCNVSIKACENGRWRPALMLLQCLLIAALQPSDVAYNALLASLQVAGLWQHGVEAFSDLESKDISPDITTYNSVIGLYEGVAHFRSGLPLQEAMNSLAIRSLRSM